MEGVPFDPSESVRERVKKLGLGEVKRIVPMDLRQAKEWGKTEAGITGSNWSESTKESPILVLEDFKTLEVREDQREQFDMAFLAASLDVMRASGVSEAEVREFAEEGFGVLVAMHKDHFNWGYKGVVFGMMDRLTRVGKEKKGGFVKGEVEKAVAFVERRKNIIKRLTEEIIPQDMKLLDPNLGIQAVVVRGSYGRGDPYVYSDLDLMLVGKNGMKNVGQNESVQEFRGKVLEVMQKMNSCLPGVEIWESVVPRGNAVGLVLRKTGYKSFGEPIIVVPERFQESVERMLAKYSF